MDVFRYELCCSGYAQQTRHEWEDVHSWAGMKLSISGWLTTAHIINIPSCELVSLLPSMADFETYRRRRKSKDFKGRRPRCWTKNRFSNEISTRRSPVLCFLSLLRSPRSSFFNSEQEHIRAREESGVFCFMEWRIIGKDDLRRAGECEIALVLPVKV